MRKKQRGFLEDSEGNLSSSRLCLITGVFTMTAIVIGLFFEGKLDVGMAATYVGLVTTPWGVGKVTDDWKK